MRVGKVRHKVQRGSWTLADLLHLSCACCLQSQCVVAQGIDIYVLAYRLRLVCVMQLDAFSNVANHRFSIDAQARDFASNSDVNAPGVCPMLRVSGAKGLHRNYDWLACLSSCYFGSERRAYVVTPCNPSYCFGITQERSRR